MANSVPAGSEVFLATYRCVNGGNEIQIGPSTHSRPAIGWDPPHYRGELPPCRGLAVVESGRRLAPCVLLRRARFELVSDGLFVTDYPRVMTGFDHIRLSRPDLTL
jgi:hypothetical protein